MVPRSDVANALADLLDDAGSLVPVHGGQLAAPGALHERDIAVTDGAGGEAHRDLTRAGRAQLDLLDTQRLVERMADGGPHRDGVLRRR